MSDGPRPVSSGAPVLEGKVKKVLFIGIDGVRADALRVSKTPYLDALIKHGAFADTTQILGSRHRLNDTVSAPGWSSILTGVWADKHGVHGSTFGGANFARYPDFLRRLKVARPAAKTAAFVSWPAITQHVVTSADVSRAFEASIHLAPDEQVAEAARRHLLEDDPDAMFVYFIRPDVTGHARGFHFRIPEYRNAIEAVDGLTGVLLHAMRARPTFSKEDWLVVVTSDHGGKGTHHRKGHRQHEVLTVFLIVSGPAARRERIRTPTYIVDAAATALGHLGVAIDAASGLDGKERGLRAR